MLVKANRFKQWKKWRFGIFPSSVGSEIELILKKNKLWNLEVGHSYIIWLTDITHNESLLEFLLWTINDG